MNSGLHSGTSAWLGGVLHVVELAMMRRSVVWLEGRIWGTDGMGNG